MQILKHIKKALESTGLKLTANEDGDVFTGFPCAPPCPSTERLFVHIFACRETVLLTATVFEDEGDPDAYKELTNDQKDKISALLGRLSGKVTEGALELHPLGPVVTASWPQSLVSGASPGDLAASLKSLALFGGIFLPTLKDIIALLLQNPEMTLDEAEEAFEGAFKTAIDEVMKAALQGAGIDGTTVSSSNGTYTYPPTEENNNSN